jgi:EAL domain-containing protein (putative c-di-GMP-specific phosphodiesterase class I)
LPRHAEDKGIAEAIIGMGKALGLTVIAEGVETPDQETFLRKHACDELQGFLFSKAVSSEDLADLLQSEAVVSSPALQPQDTEGALPGDAPTAVRSAHAA